MKKVIHYYDRFFPYLGGAETHISNIIENMKDLNFEVITNKLPHTSSNQVLFENCVIKRFGPADFSVTGIKGFTSVKQLNSLYSLAGEVTRLQRKKHYLSSADFDVIHLHAPFLSMPLLDFDSKYVRKNLFTKLLDFSRIKGPCVTTLHACHLQKNNDPIGFDKGPIYSEYFKHMIDPADEVIAVEYFIYNYLEKYFEHNDIDKNIHLIHNSIDTRRFVFSKNYLDENLKVLFVGRINKNIDYLIRFLENMPEFVEFNIVGSGSDKDFYPIENYNSPKVHIYRNISDEQLIKLYHHSNIVLNPVPFESISRVTLEAMSCGRPVIMLNKGDRRPVVDGETGFLVDNSLDTVIRLLYTLHTDEKLLLRCSENCRQVINDNFSNEAILPKISDIYKRIST